jgi:hypothetical protein
MHFHDWWTISEGNSTMFVSSCRSAQSSGVNMQFASILARVMSELPSILVESRAWILCACQPIDRPRTASHAFTALVTFPGRFRRLHLRLEPSEIKPICPQVFSVHLQSSSLSSADSSDRYRLRTIVVAKTYGTVVNK